MASETSVETRLPGEHAHVGEGGADRPAIEVVDLFKRYPKSPVDAVAGISFEVRKGEVFGLLGPNGAGKTTTVGILTTRVRPTSGIARVGGVDVMADPVGARRQLGVVPQRNNLDRSISLRNNLLFHAYYHGVPGSEARPRAEKLLEQFGLLERAGQKPDLFSGGQAQRMMIARALMHTPAVMFLDEPATGLDPAARLFVWDRIEELRQAGITVLLTTHDMDEAARLSDRVAIMDRGRILALDTPTALVRQLPGERTLDLSVVPGAEGGLEQAVVILSALAGVARVERVASSPGPDGQQGGPTRLRLYVEGEATAMVAPVAEALAAIGGRLAGVSLGEPSLEDVFISLTGRALR